LETGKIARTPPPIAPLMKANFPEVEQVARVYFRSATIEAARPDGWPKGSARRGTILFRGFSHHQAFSLLIS
jgi:hypothetical protein